MLTTDSIKEKLHQYIDVANNDKLQAIYVLVENEIAENETSIVPDWQIELGKKEVENIATNNTVLMNWNDAKHQFKL